MRFTLKLYSAGLLRVVHRDISPENVTQEALERAADAAQRELAAPTTGPDREQPKRAPEE